MKVIRAIIIGISSNVQWKHLPGNRNVEGVSVIAVCDIVVEKAQHSALEHEMEHVFTDYGHLLAILEIDAASLYSEQPARRLNNRHSASR